MSLAVVKDTLEFVRDSISEAESVGSVEKFGSRADALAAVAPDIVARCVEALGKLESSCDPVPELPVSVAYGGRGPIGEHYFKEGGATLCTAGEESWTADELIAVAMHKRAMDERRRRMLYRTTPEVVADVLDRIENDEIVE